MFTGDRLKKLREERGLSQAEVAKAIGVGRTTYLKYETGENKPTRKLEELSRLFSVSYDYLLGREESPREQIARILTSGETQAVSPERMRLIGTIKRIPQERLDEVQRFLDFVVKDHAAQMLRIKKESTKSDAG